MARAMRAGNDGLYSDLEKIAELIDKLVEDHDVLASQLATIAGKAFDSMHALDGIARTIKAGVESFKETP
jgi:hypothetical protein